MVSKFDPLKRVQTCQDKCTNLEDEPWIAAEVATRPSQGHPLVSEHENHSYPLVNVDIAMEYGHRNSGFSHRTWCFSIAMLNYQRVVGK